MCSCGVCGPRFTSAVADICRAEARYGETLVAHRASESQATDALSKRRSRWVWAIMFIFFTIAAPLTNARAQAVQTFLDVPELPVSPRIDGFIDATWEKAGSAPLDYDIVSRRTVAAPTVVRIAQSKDSLFVAFRVEQAEPIVQATETNGSSVMSDDYVGVYISPNGSVGFQYGFFANARGARYQTSSENASFTPQWTALGKPSAAGYTVTMRLPKAAIHSDGRTTWRAQFVRASVRTGAVDIWTHDDRSTSASSSAFFGSLRGITNGRITRTSPNQRTQLYVLGKETASANGGPTSRMGLDVSIPITPTASFVATIHPDFSNVEVDQQTIAPSAFPRSFTEVRPFFTQVASAFNQIAFGINPPTFLYTPLIPAFRDGFALEGTQGRVAFGAFNVAGYSRSDAAQVATYSESDSQQHYKISLQHSSVKTNGNISDELTSLTTGYGSRRSGYFGFINAAQEQGTAITDSSAASFLQTGVGYSKALTTVAVAYQRFGAQFKPTDSFTPQTDIAGFLGAFNQAWAMKPTTPLLNIGLSGQITRMRNHLSQDAQDQNQLYASFNFKNLVTVQPFYNDTRVRTFANEILPFNGSGILVGYKYKTSTPTYVSYSGGPFYHGHDFALTYHTTLQIERRTRFSTELSEAFYGTNALGESSARLWLERANLDYQMSRDAQLDVGLRRLVGSSPPTSFAPPSSLVSNACNISAAFHLLARDGRREVYLAYGDPNSISTVQAYYLKLIYYIGASKGT